MARLWSSGFESNSATQEVTSTASGSTGSIQSTTTRTGSYAAQFTGFTSTTDQFMYYQFAAALSSGPYYARAYVNFSTFPTGNPFFLSLSGASGSSQFLSLRISSAGVVGLYNGVSTQIGSNSSAVSLNTWYRFELYFNRTGGAGASVGEGRIDGVTFATSSTQTFSNGIAYIQMGRSNSTSSTVGNFFVDDVAINDNTGSFQNSYPGEGKIIHLRPNAAGDINGFTPQGTLSGTNYGQVNEVTPDDITAYVNSTTLNAEDLYNMDNSGISSSDIVNVVQGGVRIRGNSATGVPTIKLEIEKTASGTIAQGSAITPASTTWMTNAIAVPRNHSLTLYQDPDSSAWTQTTLDSMQMGFKLTVDAANRVDITAVWALVDYTPSTTPLMATLQDYFNQVTLNTGLWTQFTAGSATMGYSSTGAEMTFPTLTTSSTDGDVTSVLLYDLTSSSAYLQVLAVPSALTNANGEIRLYIDGNNYVRFVYEAGILYAQKRVAGSTTSISSVSYSSSTHAYWRIREASGTTYWDTSPDGTTWNNLTSQTNPITVTSLRVLVAGTAYQNEVSPGTFKWNNFNIIPSVASSGATMMLMGI